MKIRILFPLAAIGGLLYLHRKRGGEFTVASFKDSAKQLWDGIQRAADKARAEADKLVRERAREVGKAAEDLGQRAANIDQAFESSANNGRR